MKSVLICLAVFSASLCFAQGGRIEESATQKVIISEGNTTVTIYLEKREDRIEKIEAIRGLVKHAIRYCEPSGCENDVQNLQTRIRGRFRALMQYKPKDVEIVISGKKHPIPKS